MAYVGLVSHEKYRNWTRLVVKSVEACALDDLAVTSSK